MKIEVDVFHLDDAIEQINKFKNDLEKKNEELVTALAEEGQQRLQESYAASAVGDNTDIHVTPVEKRGSGLNQTAIVGAEGSQILFNEFGAGIHYNGGQGAAGSSPHPLGGELGYTIGSYGKGKGKKDYWWKPGGQFTHGTPATMTMYLTGKTLRSRVKAVARRIFNSD